MLGYFIKSLDQTNYSASQPICWCTHTDQCRQCLCQWHERRCKCSFEVKPSVTYNFIAQHVRQPEEFLDDLLQHRNHYRDSSCSNDSTEMDSSINTDPILRIGMVLSSHGWGWSKELPDCKFRFFGLTGNLSFTSFTFYASLSDFSNRVRFPATRLCSAVGTVKANLGKE